MNKKRTKCWWLLLALFCHITNQALHFPFNFQKMIFKERHFGKNTSELHEFSQGLKGSLTPLLFKSPSFQAVFLCFYLFPVLHWVPAVLQSQITNFIKIQHLLKIRQYRFTHSLHGICIIFPCAITICERLMKTQPEWSGIVMLVSRRSDIWMETDFTSCQLFSDYFLVEQGYLKLWTLGY